MAKKQKLGPKGGEHTLHVLVLELRGLGEHQGGEGVGLLRPLTTPRPFP